MTKLLFTLVASLFLQVTVHGQLISNQALPAAVKIDQAAKYSADMDQYGSEYKTHYKYKDKLSTFFTASNYELQILYKSGKLVFNDKVNSFVDRVFQKVVSGDAVARDVNVYVIRSSHVNAFTFHSGEIFVTLGLLAQLENEAQLAYVLAHELSHYKLGHHVKGIVKKPAYIKTSRQRTINEEAEDLLDYAFSRELEFEADSMGYYLLKNTPYTTKAAYGALDVLQYSYLPLNEIPFNLNDIFADSVAIPESHWLDKVHPINFDSDKEEDTRSTHPNIARRRKYMERIEAREGANTGAPYIIGKKEFLDVRNLARREFCHMLLQERHGVMGLYNAFVLYTENKDVHNYNLLAKGFYEVAMQKQAGTFNGNNDDEDYSEGEIERAYHFFDEQSAEEALFTALYVTYHDYKQNDNAFSKTMSTEIIDRLVNKYAVTLSALKSYFVVKAIDPVPADTVAVVAGPVDTLTDDSDSKYARLRLLKTDMAKNPPVEAAEERVSKYHYALFKNVLNDSGFVQLYAGVENLRKDKVGAGMNNLKNSRDENKDKVVVRIGQSKTVASKNAEAVKVEKALVFSPLYGTRIKVHTDFFALEQGQEAFSKEVAGMFSETGVPVSTFSFEGMDLSDPQVYTDYCHVMDYVDEIFRKDGEYMPISVEDFQKIKQSMGFSHIVLAYFSKSKERRPRVGQAIFVGIIAFPLLPAAIYYAASKETKQRCYVNIIDAGKHKTVAEDTRTIEGSKYKTPAAYFSSFILK